MGNQNEQLKHFHDSRKYIRHPVEIPLEYQLTGESFNRKDYSNNVSIGGICFQAKEKISLGSILLIKIPTIDPQFEAIGRVMWCLERKKTFDIGIEFIDEESTFKVRLIEQICYIKKYQEDILKQKGRRLDDEEAAEEWTRIFAKNFPAI
jgi:Tfp pilus assembly protein PilZ